MKKLTHREDYRPLRRAAYPDIGDQLDAIWKLLAAVVPATADDPVYHQVMVVKARLPKPETPHE